MSVFPLLYNVFTHIYTLSRIKVTRLIRRNLLLYVFNILLFTTGYSGNSSPPKLTRGEELPIKQCRFNFIKLGNGRNSYFRGWFCLVLEKQVGRRWIVKVADDAVPDRFSGWICDCGSWTWGNTKEHRPIFSRIKGRIVQGRLND